MCALKGSLGDLVGQDLTPELMLGIWSAGSLTGKPWVLRKRKAVHVKDSGS